MKSGKTRRLNRREFLAHAGAGAATILTGSGALSSLAGRRAFAADTSGYKALVCVFMYGGMDHSDTVMPYDAASWNQLARMRRGLYDAYGVGSGTSTRDRENLLKLNPRNSGQFEGREFALPGELSPLHALFEQGDLSIVGGVGPLIEPTTKTSMDSGAVAIPKRLFSHNDQQSTWMALGVEGTLRGWGGGFIDAAIRTNPGGDPTFAAISTDANQVFLFGDKSRPFRAPIGQPFGIEAADKKRALGGNSRYSDARERIRAHFENPPASSSNLYELDYAAARQNGVLTGYLYKEARGTGPGIGTVFPQDRLGGQLKTVAETIAVRSMLYADRQIFFVGMGGFDTHNEQAGSLPALHSELAGGLQAFRDAMIELNVWNDVTVFTMSDFGRTIIDNGDGTDHGWGGHQFVMGGSVRGRRIFGEMAPPDPESEAYTPTRGRLIPSVSVEQYAATLGGWFGLDSGEVAAALPNLQNFDKKDLGFFPSA